MMSCPTYAYLRLLPILALAMALVTAAAQEAGGAHGHLGVHAAERAAHWYREAAKGGDVGAMYLLASLYEQGDGVSQDLRLARHWYAQAAEHGDVAAPFKLKELAQAANLTLPEQVQSGAPVQELAAVEVFHMKKFTRRG